MPARRPTIVFRLCGLFHKYFLAVNNIDALDRSAQTATLQVKNHINTALSGHHLTDTGHTAVRVNSDTAAVTLDRSAADNKYSGRNINFINIGVEFLIESEKQAFISGVLFKHVGSIFRLKSLCIGIVFSRYSRDIDTQNRRRSLRIDSKSTGRVREFDQVIFTIKRKADIYSLFGQDIVQKSHSPARCFRACGIRPFDNSVTHIVRMLMQAIVAASNLKNYACTCFFGNIRFKEKVVAGISKTLSGFACGTMFKFFT